VTLKSKARFVAIFLPLVGGCTSYEAMPLNSASVEKTLAVPEASKLRVAAKEIKHPILKPIELNDGPGITPDQAAILAVLMNPGLRAKRDQRQLAAAQLLQAGILPNPQLNFTEDIPIGGSDQGSVNAFAVGLSWDVTSLISHDAKVRAAQAGSASVDLDIAWQEWQTAQAARTAAYDVIALEAQVGQAREVDRELTQNASVIQGAVDRHEKTVLDASAAQVASMDAHIAAISAQRDLEQQRLQLNRALGFGPEINVQVRGDVELPSHLSLPPLDDCSRDWKTGGWI
jgi:outer membrane protein TolC